MAEIYILRRKDHRRTQETQEGKIRSDHAVGGYGDVQRFVRGDERTAWKNAAV